MKRFLFVLLLSFVGANATAQTEVILPTGSASITDPDLKGLQWNRYVAGNFTIMSINDAQGKWLAENIEKIKAWCITRWGFPDFKFSKECRVMCVPSHQLMKKLF